jgi:hypothetical protein
MTRGASSSETRAHVWRVDTARSDCVRRERPRDNLPVASRQRGKCRSLAALGSQHEGELGQKQQALCALGNGAHAAMAALAVATATELGRWQSSKDFRIRGQALELSRAGKERCADGECWNTQALLDLQRAEAGEVELGSGQFEGRSFRRRLVAGALRGTTGSTSRRLLRRAARAPSPISAAGHLRDDFHLRGDDARGRRSRGSRPARQQARLRGLPREPLAGVHEHGLDRLHRSDVWVERGRHEQRRFVLWSVHEAEQHRYQRRVLRL